MTRIKRLRLTGLVIADSHLLRFASRIDPLVSSPTPSILLQTTTSTTKDENTKMSESTQPTRELLIPLILTITTPSNPPPGSPPTITLTITNPSPDTSYTLLAWDSPLDPLALPLGLLAITLPSGLPLPIELPRILVKRRTPPPLGDFVTLRPSAHASRDVVLQGPVFDAEALRAEGVERVRVGWGGGKMGVVVWEGGKEELAQAEREAMGWGDARASRWVPEAEGVEVVV
ncbi:hypothetical protein B0H67DRAFT_117676 [Lasiosphaeris hirsuta]|uniref:Uncharacterized protein n=1 Tax=Lasiosphaeris hirsuta TaxID=260670 RepID=A0AA40AZH7_9PEZI|nr:hypothetical protein B0H67DRAFT_117676 [Lasiosphaeris hirsuta]